MSAENPFFSCDLVEKIKKRIWRHRAFPPKETNPPLCKNVTKHAMLKENGNWLDVSWPEKGC